MLMKLKYVVLSWDQDAVQSQNIKTDHTTFDRVEELKYLGTTFNRWKFYFGRNWEQIEVSELFVAEPFFIQFAIQKYKDVQNYKISCCFVWVWNVVTHAEGGM